MPSKTIDIDTAHTIQASATTHGIGVLGLNSGEALITVLSIALILLRGFIDLYKFGAWLYEHHFKKENTKDDKES